MVTTRGRAPQALRIWTGAWYWPPLETRVDSVVRGLSNQCLHAAGQEDDTNKGVTPPLVVAAEEIELLHTANGP